MKGSVLLMNMRENEIALENFLDERYYIASLKKGIPQDIIQANLNYYNGAYAAISQIANITREKNGMHLVWIKNNYGKNKEENE